MGCEGDPGGFHKFGIRWQARRAAQIIAGGELRSRAELCFQDKLYPTSAHWAGINGSFMR